MMILLLFRCSWMPWLVAWPARGLGRSNVGGGEDVLPAGDENKKAFG